MAQEKTVTKMAIRASYEAVREIVGENARDMIFRDAGLRRILESPPDYTWDKEATVEEQARIYTETINLVGAVGAQGILRLIGYKITETPIVKFGVLDHIKDLSQEEKIVKAFELFQLAAGKGRVIAQPGGFPALDAFDCLLCVGITSRKPYCSHYAGCLQFLTDWVYGKGIYLVRETKCIALGDDTCRFEIEKRQ
jgi:predicted hydrocarbon binding protein